MQVPRKIWYFVSIAAFILGFGLFWNPRTKAPDVQVTDFESCVTAGYPVTQSYPRQCRTPDSRLYFEKTSEQ